MFAGCLSVLALWMVLKEKSTSLLATIFFLPVLPIVVWSIAAYRKKLWAWYAALATFWTAALLSLLLLFWTIYFYWRSYGFGVETLWLFVICWFFLLWALVTACRWALPKLKLQRTQFIPSSSPDLSHPSEPTANSISH